MLVDSSVWIESARSKSKVATSLKKVLIDQKNVIYTTKIIQLEVSQGARTREQFSIIWDGFLGLNFLEFKESFWQICALNFYKCRRSGITISTVDCMIATLAQQYHISLWSLDKIFNKAAPILGIDLK